MADSNAQSSTELIRMEVQFDEDSMRRSAADAEDRVNRQPGAGGGGRVDREKKPRDDDKQRREDDRANEKFANRIASAIHRAQQVGTGLFAAASGSPFAGLSGIAAAISGAGPIGHAIGSAVSALASLESSALDAARSLAPFNAQLFSAVTQFDYALMGIKFQLANELAPMLSKLVYAAIPLVKAFADLAAGIVNALGPSLIFLGKATAAAVGVAAKAPATTGLAAGGATGGFLIAGPQGALVGGIGGAILGGIIDISRWLFSTSDNTKEIADNLRQLMGYGQQIANGLFNAAAGWAGGGGAGFGNMQAHDPAHAFIQSHMLRLAAMKRNGQQDQVMREIGSVFPRPAPAAMNLKVTDSITVEASDYDRIHAEIVGAVDRVMAEMTQMQDSRWMRLARARIETLPRALGGMI